MSSTSRSIIFKNSILNKLHLNEIDQNPICAISKKFRTKTNRISTKSMISIEEEIQSIKSIKPYNTEKVISFQPSDYQISSIVSSQLYKNLQNKFLSMIDKHKNQKFTLKKEIKQIDKTIKQESYKTNKLVDKLLQITQSFQQTQTHYYEIKRQNYALRCQLSHRRGSQSQANWINQFHHPIQHIDLDRLSYEQILQLEERIGKQSTGLNSQDLKKLPKTKLQNITSQSIQKEEIICCICCDNINQEDTIIKLNCRHVHHAECIKKWLHIKKFCPICKTQVYLS